MVPGAPASAGISDPPVDFSYQVLSEDVYDPMVVGVAPDGRVIIGQRDGTLKVWQQNGTMKTAVKLPINARQCPTCAEQKNDDGGIYAMAVDPNFAKTGYIYLWYGRAHTGDPDTNFEQWWLSRLTVKRDSTIDRRSEKVLFKAKAWYLDPEGSLAHYGGVLEFLPDGTLVLGTGDDVDPRCSDGYGPRDNTRQRGHYCNGEMTVQNPASPWGKLLRFNTDGTAPDGQTKGVKANPFLGKKAVNPYLPDGRERSRDYYVPSKPKNPKAIRYLPCVYALGFKQPWRGSVDPSTGNLYFGDVGPDAQADDDAKGPEGYEEVNTVRYGGGGNHGWPRCVGPNLPYHDYDWAKSLDRGGPLDCSKMTSPSIWYTGVDGKQWAPLVGVGPKTGQALVHYPLTRGSLALPARFQDGIILTDWSRNYMYGVPVRKGQLVTDIQQWQVMRPGVPSGAGVALPVPGGTVPSQVGNLATMMAPIDGAVGRDGAVYLVEYGGGSYDNPLSRLSRLTGSGLAPNPERDFVRTPGVPVVSSADAFNPAPVVAAGPSRATGAWVTTPRLASGAAGLLLLALGWRRRRVTPA